MTVKVFMVELDPIELADKAENHPRFLGKTGEEMLTEVLESFFISITIEDVDG